MDSSQEGFLLIATFMVLLVCFVLAVLAVMLIYRRRKIQHMQEVQEINERFQRELLQSQLEIQMQTMEHIGRELHDNVGSQLTLASLYTNQLTPEEGNVGTQIGDIIDQALNDLRSLSKSLTQGEVMQQTSLPELLRQECQKLNRVNFCEVTYRGNALAKATRLETNSFVLRIVQEFAQNSLKHARCERISVTLDEHPNGLRLTAEDDGKGFLMEEMNENWGIGLLNMRQRAEIIHAQFSLTSAPGQGTQLELVIPQAQLHES